MGLRCCCVVVVLLRVCLSVMCCGHVVCVVRDYACYVRLFVRDAFPLLRVFLLLCFLCCFVVLLSFGVVLF